MERQGKAVDKARKGSGKVKGGREKVKGRQWKGKERRWTRQETAVRQFVTRLTGTISLESQKQAEAAVG